MTEAINRRTRAIAWAVQMYADGQPVKTICEAVGITPPTLYRYIRLADTPPLARKSKLWNNGDANPHRQKAALTAWSRRANPDALTLKKAPKTANTLELLNRLKLGLGKDNLGNYLYRGNDSVKIYLTEQEFTLLCKRPMETLKTLSARINAGLKGE